MGKIKFKLGQKYGRLTLIKKLGKDKHRNFLWECKCSCGNICVKNSPTFNNKTPSCGCTIQTEFNNVYYDYRNKAKERGLRFDISKDKFRALIEENCVYCGSPPNNTRKGYKGFYVYNGIDRIDNTIGYIEGNIVTCCYTCNHAKGTKTIEEFIEWLNTLVGYRNQL